jgi:hypothetical protein
MIDWYWLAGFSKVMKRSRRHRKYVRDWFQPAGKRSLYPESSRDLAADAKRPV